VKAPERIETSRLLLRRPTAADADAVFARYAGDTAVTRYLSWPKHESIEQTRQFLTFSDAEWNRWPAGPYLIESGNERKLIGGTGLAFESSTSASTGYVLARDAWGRGYATEALAAIVELSIDLHVRRLRALCHPEHRASIHVLEKCGFIFEERLRSFAEFPNLTPRYCGDCLHFVRFLTGARKRQLLEV
jgi:[ribosomal protein S5]-alanine N-acetyltransferase